MSNELCLIVEPSSISLAERDSSGDVVMILRRLERPLHMTPKDLWLISLTGEFSIFGDNAVVSFSFKSTTPSSSSI